MGYTNTTAHYNLPQYVSTDVPSILGDVNGAYSTIDAAIYAAAEDATDAKADAASAVSAVSTAQADATQALADAATAQGTANTANTAANSAQISANTALNKIGDTPLTTVAQTLTGAIEEVKSKTIKFVETATLTETYDGTRTNSAVMSALYGKLVTAFANLQSNEYIKIIAATPNFGTCVPTPVADSSFKRTVPENVYVSRVDVNDSNVVMVTANFLPTGSTVRRCVDNFTIDDISNTVQAVGQYYHADIIYEKYTIEP